MKRKLTGFISLALAIVLLLSFFPVNAMATELAKTKNQVKRLQGQDRYETMLEIAKKLYPDKAENVVLATGKDFADALAGVPLANQKNAPILLVNSSVDLSRDVFAYIQQHLISGGGVYILGEKHAIPDSFIMHLRSMGIPEKNIHRLGGADRYETAVRIAQELDHDQGLFYLASGSNFLDAVAASVFAATEKNESGKYPEGVPLILLPSNSKIPESVSNYFQTMISTEEQKVYVKVIGGEASIPESSLAKLKSIFPQMIINDDRFVDDNLDKTLISLYTGDERFYSAWRSLGDEDTKPVVIFATGGDFPDALTGAVLAAKYHAPLILINQNVSSDTKNLLTDFRDKNPKDEFAIIVLGGPQAFSDENLRTVDELLVKKAINYGSGSGGGGNKPTSVPKLTATLSWGSAVGSIQFASLPPLPQQATKFQTRVQDTPFAAPAYNAVFNGTDYQAGEDIMASSGQYLVLVAVDDDHKIKGYFTDKITSEMLKPPSLAIRATSISAGDDHSLAVQNDGTVICWGTNWEGQIGNGKADWEVYLPTKALNLTNVKSVAAGKYHSLALLNDGTVWGWGANYDGELMDNEYELSTPTLLLGIDEVVAIDAGDYFSMALKQDGTVWTWGSNDYGKLGNGTEEDSNEPVQVVGLNNVIAIAAGSDHALAVKDDGTVWAWGDNIAGKLGNKELGFAGESNVPVQVQGLTDVKVVAAGYGHSLALKRDGTVWAWGANNCYQLGLGDKEDYADRSEPVQVSGLSNVSEISAGSDFSLALTNTGVYGWGNNNFGQLGNGQDGDDVYSPVLASGSEEFIGISSGDEHSLGIDKDGTIWAWGRNARGQLGTNGDDSNVPVRVGQLNSILLPTSVNFDKYDASQGDVEITLNLNGNQLMAVKECGKTLVPEVDYAATDTSLVISKDYLQGKPLGQIVLTIEFSAGSPATLSIDIIGEPRFSVPVIDSVSRTTAQMSINMDLPGTVYWTVVRADSPEPDADQIISGSTGLDRGQCVYDPGNSEQNVAIDGLIPRTEYMVYTVFEDQDEKRSAVISSEVFTTVMPEEPIHYFDFTENKHGFTAESSKGSSCWTWGLPSSELVGIDDKVWATELVGNYAPNENFYLDSPPLKMPEIEEGASYAISWKQWHKFGSGDYGYVYYSKDGGENWAAFSSGHHGSSGRWETKCRSNLTGLKADDFRIRFELRSDASGTDLGWYIKDLVIFQVVDN
ncbi:MAG: hypothetical protein GX248_12180 [Peptococcaceae bacterium]|nr:hypothetical protein [Peptococcaceae bacterium]